MRVRAAVLLLALVTAGPAVAEDRARQRVGKVTLRVTQVFPESHQALVYDKATNKHVVVSEGEQLGKYEIVEVGDDEVIVRVAGRELVLPAEQAATPAKPADPAARDLLDPYAPAVISAPAPAVLTAPGPGPLDPYAAVDVKPPVATGPTTITEVLAPTAQRAGTPPAAGPVDPYAIATPAVVVAPAPAPIKPTPTPTPIKPATPPAPAPTPAVEAIRLESMTLKRGELTAALGDFDKLSKDIGFTRTSDGVRLGTVAPGSYFYGLGLRSGDVVTTIDGAPLRSLDDAAGAYARLGAAKKLTLGVDRAAAHGTLRFALK